MNATYRQAAPIFFASFALNNVVPLRAGDLYRCVSTLQLPAGTMAKSLGTLLTERLLDLGALIVLLSALLSFPPTGAARIIFASNCGASDRWARPHRGTDHLSGGNVAVGRKLVFCSASPGFQLSQKPRHGFAPSRRPFKARCPIKCAFRSSSSRLSPGRLSWESSSSSAQLLSGELLLFGGLGAGVLATLATLIPSAPGHLGTFDFFAAEGFRYGGLDAEEAVAAARCLPPCHHRAGHSFREHSTSR